MVLITDIGCGNLTRDPFAPGSSTDCLFAGHWRGGRGGMKFYRLIKFPAVAV
jgi:hypothetical protein